jgi:hypothetical protein
MVVEPTVARTGPAILQALQDVAPGEAETFADEYGAALRRAAASLDVSEAEEVLTRWWGVAYLRLNPPTEEERDLVRRLEAGEAVGWASPQDWLAVNRR